MPLSKAQLESELAALRKKLTKVLGEVRRPDQVANVNFRINVRSKVSFEASP